MKEPTGHEYQVASKIAQAVKLLDDDHVERNAFRLGAIGSSILGDISVILRSALADIEKQQNDTVRLRDRIEYLRLEAELCRNHGIRLLFVETVEREAIDMLKIIDVARNAQPTELIPKAG